MAMINSARMKVTPDQLASAIKQILNEFGDEAVEGLQRAGRKTTRETAKAVNASASSMIHGRRGKYEKSWTSDVTMSRFGVEGVVYSKQPGLPHLLEHGHAITYLGGNKSKGPGHARDIPHIQQVDDRVPEVFEANIRKEIEKL